MSKAMLVGDIENEVTFALAMVERARQNNVKHILQLGDLNFMMFNSSIKLLDVLEAELKEADIIFIFADGNHENYDALYAFPIQDDGFRRPRKHIWHAPRGHIWTIEQTTIMAMGGAHSINGPGGIWDQSIGPGNNWWPEEFITDEEVKQALQNIADWDGNIDLVIAHDVPHRMNVRNITPYTLADMLRRKLTLVADAARPSHWAAGHYHFYDSAIIPVGPDLHDETFVEILTGATAFNMNYRLIETDPFKLLTPAPNTTYPHLFNSVV